MAGHGGLVRFMMMSKTMVRLITFSGMIAALALVSILLATLSQSGRVKAAQDAVPDAAHCQQAASYMDDGYGVSARTHGVCN